MDYLSVIRRMLANTTKSCPYCGKPYPMVEYVSSLGTRIEYPDEGNCDCPGMLAAIEQARAERSASEMDDERKRVETAIERSGVPMRYRSVPPDFGHLDQVHGDKGLYIVGDVGAGKTYMASGIAIAAVTRRVDTMFTTMPDLLSRIKSSYDGKGSENEADIIDLYGSCRLLILDDLGKGAQTDWALERLFQLVNRRYENMLPTIVTTQYSRGDLIRRLSKNGDYETAKAIVSRLKETATAIRIDTPDRRV